MPELYRPARAPASEPGKAGEQRLVIRAAVCYHAGTDMPTFTPDQLTSHAQRLLAAAGVPADEARHIAGSLVLSNLMGHDSHGVTRLPQYLERGGFVAGVTIEVVREAPASAVVDGKWGYGQTVATQAMALAIDKARQTSVGVAEVFNCGHIGRLGEYVETAAANDMIGFVTCNNHGGGLLQVPFGGAQPRMSPNPIALGVPTGGELPIVIDMTSSVVAEGKIKMKRNLGEPLPDGWALDADGRPITDPEQFYGPPRGAILPFGGDSAHKGFALSILVEVLSGALGGAGYSRDGQMRWGNGVFMMAIDIAAFMAPEEFKRDTGAFVDWLKSSTLMDGFDEILLPGEPETRTRRQREADGVYVDEPTWQQMNEAAAKLGIELA